MLAALFVVGVAALGIWVASTGTRPGRTADAKSDTSNRAYDYVARDVVVQQMGPDGALQYELRAKQISQQPKDGQISAQDLVMYRDPPGTTPGGPNRLSIRADRADLPESGKAITLEGKVHAEGLPQNTRIPLSASTEKLIYNMETEDLSIDVPVEITRGRSKLRCASMSTNMKLGAVVQSNCNGTFAP